MWLEAFLDLIHIITYIQSPHCTQCPPLQVRGHWTWQNLSPHPAPPNSTFYTCRDWKSVIINKICSKFFLFRRQEDFFLMLNIYQSRERQRERLERMKHEDILGSSVRWWYVHFYHIKDTPHCTLQASDLRLKMSQNLGRWDLWVVASRSKRR